MINTEKVRIIPTVSLCLLLLVVGCQPPEPAEVAGDYRGFFGSSIGEKRIGFSAKIEQTGTTLKGTYEIRSKTHPLEGTVSGDNVNLLLKNFPKKIDSEGQTVLTYDSDEPLVLSGSYNSKTNEKVLYGNIEIGDEWIVPWQLKSKYE